MEILREKTVNGVKMIQFMPTHKMRAFAHAYLMDQDFRGQDPEFVLKGIGLSKNLLSTWRKEFNPYFEEWLEEIQMMVSKNKRSMLEFVGYEKALQGDFQFWKPFAIREKVIDPDGSTLTVIPANLGAYNDWSPDQIERHRDSLLGSLRALEDQGGFSVDESLEGGEPEGNPRGTPPVREEPLAFLEGLVPDGERALDF